MQLELRDNRSLQYLLLLDKKRNFNGMDPYQPRGGGVLPYMGYIGMCGPKGYRYRFIPFALDCTRLSPTGACSQAILVINRVSNLADSGHKLVMVFAL